MAVTQTKFLGNESKAITIIDDFALQPDKLRTIAVGSCFEVARNHYPGLRAPLPKSYWNVCMPAISNSVERMFGPAKDIQTIDASYSLVTNLRSELSIQQRLPHVDETNPQRLALVHYLFLDNGKEKDGTAFYRHRSTGFETITQARKTIYQDQVAAELRIGGPPQSDYIHGDTALYEQIFHVPARYNRAVLYRSNQLHSGSIATDTILSDDPAVGRLTVTAFFLVR